jgi:hypothetical protein
MDMTKCDINPDSILDFTPISDPISPTITFPISPPILLRFQEKDIFSIKIAVQAMWSTVVEKSCLSVYHQTTARANRRPPSGYSSPPHHDVTYCLLYNGYEHGQLWHGYGYGHGHGQHSKIGM